MQTFGIFRCTGELEATVQIRPKKKEHYYDMQVRALLKAKFPIRKCGSCYDWQYHADAIDEDGEKDWEFEDKWNC